MENNLGQVVLVKDINPGASNYGYAYASSYPSDFTEFNDKLYFSANDGENGRELWVSDGTTAGTNLIVDINPGAANYYSSGSYPSDFTEFNDKLYFSANDGENGGELWVTDGTTAGTSLLVDIRPGSSSNYYGYSYAYGSNPSNLTEFNDKLYFSASDAENGRELWVTDGTTAGTSLVVDIRPGSSSNYYGYSYAYGSNPSNLTEFNDKLYFTANDGENGSELWVTDGTTAGTSLVVDIRPGSSSNYYGYSYAYGSYPSNLTEFNDKLYFTANDGVNGSELWVTDGTTAGTSLVVDIRPGTSNYGYAYSSYISDLTEFNGKLYFGANDGENGNELWVTDGTTAGTSLLVDIHPGVSNYGYTSSSYPSNFTEFNDKLYFTANDGENGSELWVTDGTTAGTSLVANIRPSGVGSYPSNLTVVGDELFFSANDGEIGNELFKLTLDDSDIITSGTNGADNLIGSNGADQIEGLDGKDTLLGLDGKDTLFGGDGKDTLIGGDGKDSLVGGDGEDTLLGEDGEDTLIGGDGKDSLVGGDGKDSLVGGDGKDTLIGGDGKDILVGDDGKDTLIGGDGKDVFVIKSSSGEDTITDFELGLDRFGLTQGLEFDDLIFAGDTIRTGDEILANLNGVNTEQLTVKDFDVF